MTSGFLNTISKLVVITMVLVTPVVNAALPLAVDGNKLPSLAPMLEKVTPAVVNIATEGRIKQNMNPLFADPFFKRFFNIPDQPIERKTSSLGSGVIVDDRRGLILTNHHVIANADQITVTLRDGRALEAEVVGTDPETDVAVIKIQADNLTAISITDSESINVGDFVVAIGNPFGLGQTVTSGIVSALSRSGLGIEGYEDFIQTDASINPGNSGGALVNLRGELIGINTAIFSRSGGNIGIGFAIPINMATNIMEQLLETGEVKRAFLGVSMQNVSPELAEAFQLKQQTGAIINKVLEMSPAEEAGLQPGDIVLAVDGKKIRSAEDLRNRVGLLPVGKKIRLTILRDGKEKKLTVNVSEKNVARSETGSGVGNDLLEGVTISNIDRRNPAVGNLQGVQVLKVERGTLAWSSGLRDGDIITSVNQQDVVDARDFLTTVNKVPGSLVFRIVRGNAAAFLVLKR